MISSNLRQALRTHGFHKLAYAVRESQGRAWVAPGSFDHGIPQSLASAVEDLSMKVAASRVNDLAVESGLQSYERLEKKAIVGPLIDVANLGIPSAIGYAVGHGSHVTPEEAEARSKAGVNPLAALMVPGYFGYYHGERRRAREVYEASLKGQAR